MGPVEKPMGRRRGATRSAVGLFVRYWYQNVEDGVFFLHGLIFEVVSFGSCLHVFIL
jgi:hypothetical protein